MLQDNKEESVLKDSHGSAMVRTLMFLSKGTPQVERNAVHWQRATQSVAEEDDDIEMQPVEQQPQQLEAEVPDVEQDILKYYREDADKEVDSVTSNAQLQKQVGKAAFNYVEHVVCMHSLYVLCM